MNTIEESKKTEDDPFSITTPPPSPPSLMNYQQRLSYSLSFNNTSPNTTNLLHRSQSLALDNHHVNNKKKRPNHLNKLWRQSTTTSSSFNNKEHLLNKELPLTPNILLSQSPMDRILATSPPTLKEFHQWIHHYLLNIEDIIQIENLNIHNDHQLNYQQEINSKLVIAKDCLLRLINTLDSHLYNDKKMNMIHLLHQPLMDSNKLLQTLQHIHLILKPCLNYHTVLIDSSTTETNNNIMETPCLTSATIDYSSLWPDHLDANIHWFHDYFYGKDYLTLFIPLDKTTNTHNSSYAIVNVIYELISSTSTFLKTSCSDDDPIIEDDVFNNEDCNNDFNDIENSQYRIIIRIPKCFTKRYVVTCAQAYDYMNKHGGLNVSFKTSKSNRKSALKMSQLSTHFASQYRYLSAALHSVCPELNLHQAFLLPSSITSSCGIEKELLHIDGIEAPPHYKFGVLNIKKNQTKEEDFFANTGLSSSFDQFLNILGNRIKLKGYNGYTAGLDTRTGETGDTSVVSKWRGHDIMFHVAPLMPFLKNDKQQVQRKRYIGNDIVSVVFLEDNSIFNPESIRSKFIHVYIVVRQEITNGKLGWRVEVVRRNNVPEFGPSLPTPPIFYDENVLHQFLTIKLVNAENAALKSENFVTPNFRARAGIIENLVEKGISQKECIAMSSIMVSKSFRHRRPKSSSGSQRLSRASLRSIRSSPDSSSQYLFSSSPSSSSNNHPQGNNNNVDLIPPVPTPTRSTMLQDLKNFALRRAPTLTHPKSTSSKESYIGKKDRNGSIGSGDDTLSILNNNNNNINNNIDNNINNNIDNSINNNDNNNINNSNMINNDNNNNTMSTSSTTTTTTSNNAQQIKKPSYTSSFPSMASNLLFRQNGNSNNDDSIVQSNKSGGSILAAKARTVFFNRTTSSASLAVNSNSNNPPPKPKKTFSSNLLQQNGESGIPNNNSGSGLRHKAQNLVINAVRRSGQNGNQQPLMPTLKE